MEIGFHASHELFPPSQLLSFVRQAEQAGFKQGMCSDHFAPWTENQGESGYTWSWLGAALQATRLPFGTVCAPGQRYHPAIIAQAAATLAEMFPRRLWVAFGTGQAINEHITGAGWPAKSERRARLREAVDVVRALWRGETVNHRGRIVVDNAKLYTRPAEPPLLIGAAISDETAEWVGTWADGLITVAKPPADLQKTIAAFHRGGGSGKPMFVQAALSFAETEEKALNAARKRWPICALPPHVLSDTPTPRDFQARLDKVTDDDVRNGIRVSSDLNQHIKWLRQDADLGISRVYLHHVGPDMERFIAAFGEKVLPRFA